MRELLIFLAAINIFSYAIMWIQKWRVSEKTLWTLAIFGGVFGVWLGMQAPIYHKAGKSNFKILIPIIAFVWVLCIIFVIH